jgi:outer membrane protein, heavy metal efflux system
MDFWCGKKKDVLTVSKICKIKLALSVVIYCMCTIAHAYRSPLNAFVNQVLENNPAILAAQSNVLAAKARERASGQPLYNPELTAEKQNALENTTSVGINQTIDWINKRGAREQVGAANALVAEAQLGDLRQQLAAEILTALAKYQVELRVVSLAKERTSLLQQFVDLTRKRYKSGDIARVDLDLAQLALSEAMAQQAEAEVNANQALQVLRATTGFNQINWPNLSPALPKPVLTDHIDVDHFMHKLPAVLVLNQQYQTARARIKLAERERYPDPTIGIQGGESSGDGESKRLVGITLNIPLFVRNPYRAEVDAANYDALEAEGKRADIVRKVRAEIKSSAERYQMLYRVTQQWQQVSGKPLSDGMTLIARLWQAGEINTTDYLVQLKQRIDSQIAGVELKGRAWEAWVEWLRASGQVESWLQLESSGDE